MWVTNCHELKHIHLLSHSFCGVLCSGSLGAEMRPQLVWGLIERLSWEGICFQAPWAGWQGSFP